MAQRVGAGTMAVFGEQIIAFVSALECPGLDATGAVADIMLTNQAQ
jgi:hypothetical protein